MDDPHAAPHPPALQAAHLTRLYMAMSRLNLIAGATSQGGVARAVREAQRDLWPVIEHFGGDREDYSAWQMEREWPTRVLGQDAHHG